MEILAYNNSPGGRVVSLRQKSVYKGLHSCRLKLPTYKKPNIFCVVCLSKEVLRNRVLVEGFKCLDSYKRLNRARLKSLSRNYNSYVVSGEEDVEGVPEIGESTTTIQIPGLPDESSGERGAQIRSCFWEWKPKLKVHYEKAGCENVTSPPLLLLPGFGVGSFHYEKQLKDLGRDYRVWAIDFLGQGLSLPIENPTVSSKEEGLEEKSSLWGFGDEAEPWASNLSYSIDLWQDQVRSFVEEVIGKPVYVVGNSLGGYVALYFAASNPQLVKGVTLLNATPFWGFLPNPVRFPTLAKILPWSGTFPLPSRAKKPMEFLWQKISDPGSVTEVLKQVYADHSTNIEKVVSRILEITQHPAAAASFASIMLAPQGQLSFNESLSLCRTSNVPICLMYGKEDPWVRPVWGLQVKRQLPDAPYYEISPAGHCPHDEVPEVVNYLLRGWIKSLESNGSVPLPLLEETESKEASFAWELEFVKEGSIKLARVKFYGSRYTLWNGVSSWIKTQFGKLKTTA